MKAVMLPTFTTRPLMTNSPIRQSLSPEEQRLFRLYGKLPSRSDHFAKHLKERKYFDSGDYAMNKAGKGNSVDTGAVGSQHPLPENIPHLTSPVMGPNGHHLSISSGMQMHPHQHSSLAQTAGSPVKESSSLNREASAEDLEEGQDEEQQKQESVTAEQQQQQGVPART
ncbi:hypothetical protein VTJ49DRAFT_5834 [Mycothermus thermophilus]|uniref:mRNA stability protein n=1 Tax=Humicola insolens TaxID=85995 RepID=A0ABR3VKU8_HUMIN